MNSISSFSACWYERIEKKIIASDQNFGCRGVRAAVVSCGCRGVVVMRSWVLIKALGVSIGIANFRKLEK